MEEIENGPELIINKSSSKDGNVGWSIRLQRRHAPLMIETDDAGNERLGGGGETDEEYFQRTLAMHQRCERELLGKESNGN